MSTPVLSAAHPLARFACGDFDAVYVLDPITHAVGLRLLPHAAASLEQAPRPHIEKVPEVANRPDSWGPVRASAGETPLVLLKLEGDPLGKFWVAGRTLRHNATVDGLRLAGQSAQPRPQGGWRIVTTLRGNRPILCHHVLDYVRGDEAVTVHTEVENIGPEPLRLELLSSFSLGQITPYAVDDAPERIRLHRFRSYWAMEGRHEAPLLEELHLERACGTGTHNLERFGQVGSVPVRGWFPWVAAEDTEAGVFWGAQLHAPGSWQIEVVRRDDRLALSGGLPDREFGDWSRTLAPGETFRSPSAWLSTARADLDGFSQRLVRMQTAALQDLPTFEQDLPVVFNEWCTSWGHPTAESVARTAARVCELPVRYFVIDAGWFEDPARVGQFNGDWIVDRAAFPSGLKPVCDDLRARGLVPGLWFEFENATRGTTAYELAELHLRSGGQPLEVGNRRFWDFNHPGVHALLAERVIARLREDGFGYLKVDYNECTGVGADHPDGLGEGLRLNLHGVQDFFHRVRRELPDVLIENCASGGHRLEPTFLGLTAVSSSTDMHEGHAVPIISANLHRLMLPRQCLIWAVLHPTDTPRRLHWSLAAGFLGRICLSGHIADLDASQMDLVRADLEFYRAVVPIIRDGESRLTRSLSPSWTHPRGWQAVLRTRREGSGLRRPREALLVAHAFGDTEGACFDVPLPLGGGWKVVAERGIGLELLHRDEQGLCLRVTEPFSAYVAHLIRD